MRCFPPIPSKRRSRAQAGGVPVRTLIGQVEGAVAGFRARSWNESRCSRG